jgi:4'-phosphopantetheinyl transferase
LINESTESSSGPVAIDANDLTGVNLTLGAQEVHVWHASLDDHAADRFQLVLADDEISRADRFHFAKDRNHYVVARGLLRKLLGGYAGVAASDLRFAYTEKGKPSLAEREAGLINFNLAHSHGRAIYAFTVGRELGVDLEFMRTDFAGGKIAERFFSTAEIIALTAVPPELKQRAFFDCWTRKEAYLKARGDGLSMPLDKFEVSLAPGEEAALLWNYQDPAEVTRWTMHSIPAPSGYAAALVVEGQDWSLKTFRLV